MGQPRDQEGGTPFCLSTQEGGREAQIRAHDWTPQLADAKEDLGKRNGLPKIGGPQKNHGVLATKQAQILFLL